jgi:hypothetical protein
MYQFGAEPDIDTLRRRTAIFHHDNTSGMLDRVSIAQHHNANPSYSTNTFAKMVLR